MKVSASSLISAVESCRAAPWDAIGTLVHELVAAEELGAHPDSPQLALANAGASVVLIVGDPYGALRSLPGSPRRTTNTKKQKAMRRFTPSCKRVSSEMLSKRNSLA